jgi:mannose-6-phosphate isomerase-like protein (cupin superfamily)
MESFSAEEDWFPPPGGVTAAIVTYEPGFQYPMHQTHTLDVGFVISGRLKLVLENGSTVLGPGECYVQRGTAHSWRVVGDEPCAFCGIAVGAAQDPAEGNSQEIGA